MSEIIFQCSWCKKKNISPAGWSKNKEPLCSECAYKYNFGLKQRMITGNVSELPKEQRRRISEKMNSFERFWGALRSVEREVLVGRAKTLSLIVGWVLAAIFMVGISALSDWFFAHNFLELVIVVAYIFLAYLFHERVVWHIKYWQLKKKVEESGYKGI